MTTTQDATLAAVRSSVAEALGITEAEVTPEASLFDDLGAESIDLIDILFRVERKTGTKLKAADIADFIQGGIPDEVFGDENDRVTDAGLAHLKTLLPQIDVDALRGNLEAEKVINLVTVANLADLVARQAARA